MMKKIDNNILLILLCSIFFFNGCSIRNSPLKTKNDSVVLPEMSEIEYNQGKYEEIFIGSSSFLLPSRLERESNLISKIRREVDGKVFTGRVSIMQETFCVPLFAFEVMPIKYTGLESTDTLRTFYLNDRRTSYWEYMRSHHNRANNYLLFDHYKYLVKMTFDADIRFSKEELNVIMASFDGNMSFQLKESFMKSGVGDNCNYISNPMDYSAEMVISVLAFVIGSFLYFVLLL